MKNKLTTNRFAVFATLLFLFFSVDNSNAQTCGIPQNLHINSLTTSSGVLEWYNVSDVIEYVVRFQVAGTNSWQRQTSTNNTEIITGLIPGTQYEAKVRTTCSLSESNYSNTIFFTTPSNLSCAVPNVNYFTSTNITTNSCKVGWRSITGIYQFTVQYRVRYSNSAWLEGNTNTNSLTLSGLIPYTQYEFKVKSNCTGVVSAYSSAGIFTTLNNACGIPADLHIDSITYNSVKINWSSLSCASSYKLKYRIQGGSWNNVNSSTNSLQLSSLIEGTSYEFMVQSINSSGASSAFSQSQSFSTSSSNCETPIDILANTITTDHVTISWSVVLTAASYNVRYRLAGALTWQTVSTTVNIIDINGLSQDNAYEFQVQSVCSPTESGSFSPLASFLTLTDITNAIPVPDHIVICILENKSYSQIANSIFTPHINALINDSKSAVFTESYGITHPSQPNYIHLFSGAGQGVTNNVTPAQHFTTPNLARELLNAGRTFATYSQGLPSAGYDGSSYGRYVRKHNPVANWMGTGTNQVPSTLNLPFTGFPTDYSTLPTVSFVVPDLTDGMHDGSLGTALTNGDNWFYNNMKPYVDWAKNNNSLFILTTDEDDGNNSNRILTVLCGSMVVDGSYSQAINHYSLLRTISEMYGLNFIGAAANASAIHGCWTNGFRLAGETETIQSTNDELTEGWKVYPNPAYSEVHVSYELKDDAETTIRIYSSTGSLAFEKKLGVIKKGKHIYDVPLADKRIPAGIYFLDITFGTEKFIQRFLVSQ